MRLVIAPLVGLVASVSAVGNAVVKNNCASPFYVWSVGGTVGPQKTVAPGAIYTETLRHDPKTGGIALKIAKTPEGLTTGAPIQTFSYSLDGALVWYDMSTVMGEPFHGQHIKVTSEGCPTIDWEDGTHPGGSQVKVCGSENDVVFTACA